MKVTVEHASVPSTDSIDSLVEDRILALSRRIQIEEARVRLECCRAISPKYRVSIHIVTPGPDLLADERDHTLPAAIEKVMTRLEARLAHREGKRRRRARGNLQLPAISRGRQNASANSGRRRRDATVRNRSSLRVTPPGGNSLRLGVC
jgi:ribosomal subunit interface protein